MSHLDFVRPGGVWSGEMCPGAQDYQRLDDHQFRIVNGDAGGTWNPTSPIVIGGAGITFNTSSTQISGGVTTKTGGRVQLGAVPGSVPTFTTTQTDTVIMSCSDLEPPIAGFGSGYSWLLDDYNSILTAPSPVGVQSIANQATAAMLPVPSRYLHQGASFNKIQVRFRVTTKPNAAVLPALAFGLLGLNVIGTALQPLAPGATISSWTASTSYSVGAYVNPASAGGHINGFYYKATSVGGSGGISGTNPAIFDGLTTIGNTVTDNPGTNQVVWTCTGQSGQLSQFGLTPATYYNNGLPQVIELDFDNATSGLLAQNAIDHGTYAYEVFFGALGDTSTLNASVNIELHSVQFYLSNIVDIRFE